jgi:hypothetical protein
MDQEAQLIMILTNYTQADMGDGPTTLLTESNGKGIYCMIVNITTAPGVGAAGSVEVRFTWVDARSVPHALATVLSVAVASDDALNTTLNIGAGVDLEVRLEDAGAASGAFSVAVEAYVARQNSLGND